MNQAVPKGRGRLFRDKDKPYSVLRWRDKSRHWSPGSVGPACSGLHEKLHLGERLAGESQVPDVGHTLQADRGCCQQIRPQPGLADRHRTLALVLGQRKEGLPLDLPI